MAEPTSGTLITATSILIGVGSLCTGLDGNALIGAFAGATLFAVSSQRLSLWQRLAYTAISLVFGYLCAPEVIKYTLINESGIAAFFAAAAAVTLTLHGIKLIETIELPKWLRNGGDDV